MCQEAVAIIDDFVLVYIRRKILFTSIVCHLFTSFFRDGSQIASAHTCCFKQYLSRCECSCQMRVIFQSRCKQTDLRSKSALWHKLARRALQLQDNYSAFRDFFFFLICQNKQMNRREKFSICFINFAMTETASGKKKETEIQSR